MSGFKPGDVAMVTYRTASNSQSEVLCFRRGGWWIPADASVASLGSSLGEVVEVRPLVVIDPESWDSVGELREALFGLSHDAQSIPEMQAALREFANPTPTIEEPTGLGAVVEDANGRLWVRAEKAKGMQNPWQDTLSDDPVSDRIRAVAYAEISVVRVLSEGIS